MGRWGQPGFGWFVVLEDDRGVGDGVGFGGQKTRGGVVGFLLFRRWTGGGTGGFVEGGGCSFVRVVLGGERAT